MTEPDPRWADMIASSGMQEINGHMLEHNIKPWYEIRFTVFYKGIQVWITRQIHPDDIDGLMKIDIFAWLCEEMIARIDEGLDRVDAGEREFSL